MDNLSKKQINKKNINDVIDLKPIPVEADKIFVDGSNNYIVMLKINEELYSVLISPVDGSHLTFVDIGCAEKSHIYTIYQILINFKKTMGFILTSITIESKVGDIIYCRACWTKNKKNIYNICGIGDGLILSKLTNAPIFIIKNVIDKLEPMEDWNANDELYED